MKDMRCKRNVCSAMRSTGLQFWYNGCCQFCSRLVHVLQELDFVNEAKNCEQCAHNFATMSPQLASKIAFPKIYWQWSTSKLLTMEFMEGVGITDVQAIQGLGVRPADVASLVRLFLCACGHFLQTILLHVSKWLNMLFIPSPD
jgi:hypothetical protein